MRLGSSCSCSACCRCIINRSRTIDRFFNRVARKGVVIHRVTAIWPGIIAIRVLLLARVKAAFLLGK